MCVYIYIYIYVCVCVCVCVCEKKRRNEEELVRLLPNCVTIQWKLYRDIAFWACSELGSMSRYNRIVS